MFRAEVLTPNGLVNATGYFGPSSRAKANDLCIADATTGEVEEAEEGMEEEDEDADVTLGGEASLDSVDLDSASNEDIEEGTEDGEVAEFVVEFTDGDASISRLDISFDSQDASDAWDVLDEVSLWVDGDKVASMDANDEDDFQNDEKTLRFTNLDIVAMEDEELEIIIAVSTQNSIDALDRDTYLVNVTSMRFFDADGVATTESITGVQTSILAAGQASFTVREAGFEDELDIKTSSNDPDRSTLQVEDNAKSDWYTVFVFDLDTDDSINDIELNTLAFDVTTGTAAASAVIDDMRVTIDGEVNDDWMFSAAAVGQTRKVEFDIDGDIVIDAGDQVVVEVEVKFKSANGVNYAATGETFAIATDGANFDVEGADDVATGGSADSETHLLLTQGMATEMTDSSAVATVVDGVTNDYATFEIEVDITAFEQDVYIETDASDINAAVVSSAGVVLAAGPTIILDSSASEVLGRFEIKEGSTETITLQVTFVPGGTNTSARLQLNSIGFYASATALAGTVVTQTTLPISDYRTSNVTIVN